MKVHIKWILSIKNIKIVCNLDGILIIINISSGAGFSEPGNIQFTRITIFDFEKYEQIYINYHNLPASWWDPIIIE